MTHLLSLPPAVAEALRATDDRVLVTGATGWLGQALLEMLSEALGSSVHDRVHCFGSAPKPVRLRNGVTLVQRPLPDLSSLPKRPSMLFHFAYLTKEKTANMPLADYVDRNRAISALTASAAAKIGADRIFLTSSGAVYQALAASATVDSIHAYGALKLEDEALFRCYAIEVPGRKVLAVRLFNLSGPYINKLNSYALSSFIEQARRDGVIEIKASHRVVRSYAGAENLLATAVAHLLADDSDPWTCMDTAGEVDIEVGDLAGLVRARVNPSATVRRPAVSGGLDDRYVGDAHVYRTMAARHGVDLHSLDRQIQDTSDYLAELSP